MLNSPLIYHKSIKNGFKQAYGNAKKDKRPNLVSRSNLRFGQLSVIPSEGKRRKGVTTQRLKGEEGQGHYSISMTRTPIMTLSTGNKLVLSPKKL